MGICKYTIQEQGHTEWVSCVRFSPLPQNPVIVSSGWDKLVKVWNLSNCKLKRDYRGHTGYLNTVTVSPDGSLCASGGRDGQAKLWDLGSEEAKPLHTLDGGEEINALCFSPNRYWLCAAAGPIIKIWDLEQKTVVEELKPEVRITSITVSITYNARNIVFTESSYTTPTALTVITVLTALARQSLNAR